MSDTFESLDDLADKIEQAALTHAKLFVSRNIWVSCKAEDMHLAASCFAVVDALRARSKEPHQ